MTTQEDSDLKMAVEMYLEQGFINAVDTFKADDCHKEHIEGLHKCFAEATEDVERAKQKCLIHALEIVKDFYGKGFADAIEFLAEGAEQSSDYPTEDNLMRINALQGEAVARAQRLEFINGAEKTNELNKHIQAAYDRIKSRVKGTANIYWNIYTDLEEIEICLARKCTCAKAVHPMTKAERTKLTAKLQTVIEALNKSTTPISVKDRVCIVCEQIIDLRGILEDGLEGGGGNG